MVTSHVLNLLAHIQDYGPTNVLSYEDCCSKAFCCLYLEVKGERILFSWSKQVTKQCLDIPDCQHALAHFSIGWECN